MEIPRKVPLLALQVHPLHPDDSRDVSSPPSSGRKVENDTVALSRHASNVRNAVRVVRNVPDVREDKVAAMRRRIESGTYRITGETIATHLIGESMQNNDILDQIDGEPD
jgi:negative regulator of flagellin synthesis FlgM